MTTFRNRQVTCAICDSVSEQRALQSCCTFEQPDLDGRPAEMARSTMNFWVQTCPECGFCAEHLAQAHPSARDVVRSETYRARLHHPETPALLNHFLCLALLSDAEGNMRNAAECRLHAAWVADDAGLEELARRCRSESADLLLNAPALTPGESQVETDWEGWRGVQLVDVLRRAGRGAEARHEADRVRQAGASSRMKQLLVFECAAVARGDTSRRTLNEGLGLPLPPELSPPEDPLLTYLLSHYGPFVTDLERQAAKMWAFNTEAGPRWATDQPEILALLTKGKAGLGHALAQRLLAAHPDTVFINRCPKCDAVTRTPKARQCRVCPHTWRDVPR